MLTKRIWIILIISEIILFPICFWLNKSSTGASVHDALLNGLLFSIGAVVTLVYPVASTLKWNFPLTYLKAIFIIILSFVIVYANDFIIHSLFSDSYLLNFNIPIVSPPSVTHGFFGLIPVHFLLGLVATFFEFKCIKPLRRFASSWLDDPKNIKS